MVTKDEMSQIAHRVADALYVALLPVLEEQLRNKVDEMVSEEIRTKVAEEILKHAKKEWKKFHFGLQLWREN